MQKLTMDSGIREYRVGSGVLRMNPADPNLYDRFVRAAEQIDALQAQLLQQEGDPDFTRLLADTDQKIKQQLNLAFGAENDFEKLLGGVNVFAPGENGQPVLSNLFAALQPVLEEGVRRWTGQQVEQAVAASKRRKAQKS